MSLQLDPCLAVDRAQVERLLVIELSARLAPLPDDDTSDLSVGCGPVGAELRVDDPVTGKSLLRTIDLGLAPPQARPRLLALALAELLFASWTELALGLRPDPPPPPPEVVPPGGKAAAPASARSAASQALRAHLPVVVQSAPRPAPAPDRPPARPVARLLAVFAGQAGRGSGLLLGGGARAAVDLAHHLGVSADVLAHHGQGSFPLGTVTTDEVSAAAALLFHGRLGFLDLRAGAGARLGAVRIGGEPADPALGRGAALWGPVFGPLATLSAGAALPAHLAVELAVEAGYVVLPVSGRVDGVTAVSVDGGWFGAQLGLGWRR